MKNLQVSLVEAKLGMGADYPAQAIEVIKAGKPSKKDGHTYARIRLKQSKAITNLDLSNYAAVACANPATVLAVDTESNKQINTEEGFTKSNGFHIPDNVAIGQADGELQIALLS